MNRSTRTYNKNTNPFFSFTGNFFLKEKTYVGHYSYDVHGNVKTLIQDNAGVSIPEQRYKRMDYEYDLISGKVNTVHYQNNQPDQFHHKYEYDADNRITDVYTSKDKILWDHDAKYFYYPHGPLARVEYGDNHVQGMDYAYTLQGWIKGVNSETLENTRDMGRDGNNTTGNLNQHFAKDAFGYSLTYFENDYKSIGTTSFLANKPNSDLLKARNDLFNGNISAMVTTITNPLTWQALPQGTAYKYDQLNRLLESKAFSNIDAASNAWQGGSTYNGMYHNKFTYDGNGNIEAQLRKDQSGNIMDAMVYNYNVVNGKKVNNRLQWVDDDQTLTSNFTEDIDDQEAGNYTYDEIGNLIQDAQEEIQEITWTASGKVKEVKRTPSSVNPDLLFAYDATGNRISKTIKLKNSDGTLKSSAEWTITYYTRDAQGNVMSIYKQENDAATTTASFAQTEKPIYGSTRIGTEKTEVELIGASLIDITQSARVLGNKEFEGSNHLGNVSVVVSDRKIPELDGSGNITGFHADVVSATDYYPFGMMMPGRNFNSTDYRFGFNEQESVDEISGTKTHYTAPFWEYDTRVVLRWNQDPKPTIGISPYAIMQGNPIWFNDPLGDTVWVYARKLNFSGGSVGVHTFVVTKPDDDPSAGYTTYSFYEDEEGELTGTKNWADDKNWPLDKLKGQYIINTPKGSTDAKFIKSIDKNFKTFQRGLLEYEAFPGNTCKEGNCNTSTTTLLQKSGVPLNEIKNIDPPGLNPGLGETNPWTIGEQQQLQQKQDKEKEQNAKEKLERIESNPFLVPKF